MGNLGLGGMRNQARRMQSAGRNGDTMLAHINPREAFLLKKLGGRGSVNPLTGLYEFSEEGEEEDDEEEEEEEEESSWYDDVVDTVTDWFDGDDDEDNEPSLDELMSQNAGSTGDRPNETITTNSGDIITKVYANDGSGNYTLISAQGNDTSQIESLHNSGETLSDAVNTVETSGGLDTSGGNNNTTTNTTTTNTTNTTATNTITDEEFKQQIYNLALNNVTDGAGNLTEFEGFNTFDANEDGTISYSEFWAADPLDLTTAKNLGIGAISNLRAPKLDASGNPVMDADGEPVYEGFTDINKAKGLVKTAYEDYSSTVDTAGDVITGAYVYDKDGNIKKDAEGNPIYTKGALDYVREVAGGTAPIVTSTDIDYQDPITAGTLTGDYTVSDPTKISVDQIDYDDVNLDEFGNKYTVTPDEFLDEGDTVSSSVVTPKTFSDIAIGSYMDPYISGVVDPAMAKLEEQRQKSLQTVGANALANKAFGGTRQALREAETNKAAMEAAGELSGQLYSQGYQQASELAMRDMDRLLSGDLSTAEFNMMAQKYNLDSDNMRDITNLQSMIQSGEIDAANALKILTDNATGNLQADTSEAQFKLTADQANSTNELRAAIESASNVLTADEINVANQLLADVESGKIRLDTDKTNAINELTAQIKSGEFSQNQDAITLDASQTMGALGESYADMSLDEFMAAVNAGEFGVSMGDKEIDREYSAADWYKSFGLDKRDRDDALKKFGMSEFYREEDDPYKKMGLLGAIMTGAPIPSTTSYGGGSGGGGWFGK